MNEIFLSYRRADEKGTTGRLFDHLVQAFGRDAIFYDVEKIPHGDDFREFIDKTIRNCKAVLVVIGPHWLEMTDESGQRRLEKVNDPVRIEVETAFDCLRAFTCQPLYATPRGPTLTDSAAEKATAIRSSLPSRDAPRAAVRVALPRTSTRSSRRTRSWETSSHHRRNRCPRDRIRNRNQTAH